MIKWTGSTARRYPPEPLTLDGTRQRRPFTGTPIRGVRRPLLAWTPEEILRTIVAVLVGLVGGYCWAVVLLALAGR